jgi:high-affinity Fe2+/Pb2+ permease
MIFAATGVVTGMSLIVHGASLHGSARGQEIAGGIMFLVVVGFLPLAWWLQRRDPDPYRDARTRGGFSKNPDDFL